MEKGSPTVEQFDYDDLVSRGEIPCSEHSEEFALKLVDGGSNTFACTKIEELLDDGPINKERATTQYVQPSKKIKEDAGASHNISRENVEDDSLLKGWIIKKKERTTKDANDNSFLHLASGHFWFRSYIQVEDFVFHGIRPKVTKKGTINPEDENGSDAKEAMGSNKRSRRKSSKWTFTEQGYETLYKGKMYQVNDITFPNSSSPKRKLVSQQTQSTNKRGRKPGKKKMECDKPETGETKSQQTQSKNKRGRKPGKKKMECDKPETGETKSEQVEKNVDSS